MTKTLTGIGVALCSLSTFPGCGDDGEPVAGPCEIELAGTVREFVDSDLVLVPSVGATVCEHPYDECTTSEADGAYALCVEESADVAITYRKDGFAAQVWLHTTGASDDTLDLNVYSDAVNEPFYADSDIPYPPTDGGNLAIGVDEPGTELGISGATVSLSPSAGVGPYYIDAFFTHYDPDLSATTRAGAAGYGALPTGLYDVFIDHPVATDCVLTSGAWSSPVAGASARVWVVAGFETYAFFECAEP